MPHVVCRFAIASLLAACAPAQQGPKQPNIVWILAEDQSDHFGVYGETLAKTPNVDSMAAEGVRFTRAFVTAPVCSPSRSALVTGMYQTTIGAHNHRSGRGDRKIRLPDDVEPLPAMLRRAGYYVSNGGFRGDGELVRGKTDYNFEYDPNLYDAADWSKRAPGQPFFAQVQLRGGKRRDQRTLEALEDVHTHGIQPDKVKLPPYYPDHPELRKDWAQYLESIENTDWEVGRILERLETEGLDDNTIVFFLTDHGVSHARGKQFLNEEGTRIPLVVRARGLVEPGMVREDLVAHIDVAASTLALAGIEIPAWMEGRPLFGPGARPRHYVVSARDRCDETVDRIRSVRTRHYRYVRNFVPERPHLQPNRYKDSKAILRAMHEMRSGAGLPEEMEAMFYEPRPEEELYDLRTDPWETTNLVEDPDHRDALEGMRGMLRDWIEETGDRGQRFETDAEYGSDMAVYLRGREASQTEILRRNIADVNAWRKARADGP